MALLLFDDYTAAPDTRRFLPVSLRRLMRRLKRASSSSAGGCNGREPISICRESRDLETAVERIVEAIDAEFCVNGSRSE